MWHLSLFLVLLSLTDASAADWPQWRGPNRDGISPETGLLKSWPEEGPPLEMKVEGLGSEETGQQHRILLYKLPLQNAAD